MNIAIMRLIGKTAWILLLTLISNSAFTQSTSMYGAARYGGHGAGTIFKTDATGNNPELVHAFLENPGSEPRFNLLDDGNGVYYGITRSGGAFYNGVIYKYDLNTDEYKVLYEFEDEDEGYQPDMQLFKGTDGKLYGSTRYGGDNSRGVLFSFDPNLLVYNVLADFNSAEYDSGNGVIPSGTNSFVGVLRYGGNFGAGAIYKYNYSNGSINLMHSFVDSTGRNPRQKLLLASNGKYYGTANNGGSFGDGVLFSFDPASNIYTKLYDFSYQVSGTYTHSENTEHNGYIYGTTNSGGPNSDGVLYRYEIATGSFEIVYAFDYGISGGYPEAAPTVGTNGKLYGTTTSGGGTIGGSGTIYEYDPIQDTLIIIRSLDAVSSPNNAKLIEYDTNQFLGIADYSSKTYSGSIFTYDQSQDVLTEELAFNDVTNGYNPQGGLLDDNSGYLYGVTKANSPDDGEGEGGYNGYDPGGTIFRIDKSNDSLATIYEFESIGGSGPSGGLTASNGWFYGLTSIGGFNDDGVIYRYAPSSDVYQILHNFNGTDGSSPNGELEIVGDSILYGVTQYGGNSGYGTLFQYNINSQTFIKLFDFNDTIGGYPENAPIYVNNALYGVAPYESQSYAGVLYRFKLDSLQYTVLEQFGNSNGEDPTGRLTLIDSNTFIGVCQDGPGYLGEGQPFEDDGIVFGYNIPNNSFTMLHIFDNNGFNRPASSFVSDSNGVFYSTTRYGGTDNLGGVYSMDFSQGSQNLYSEISAFTAETGYRPYNSYLTRSVNCSESRDTVVAVACDSFVSNSGKTYHQTGIYNDTLTNVQGCDSIVRLDLTINHSTYEVLEVEACDSFVSPNGTTHYQSGLFKDTLQTTANCDSIIKVDLTIHYSTYDTSVVVACDSFVAPSGKSYHFSGIFFDTTQTSNDCDSVLKFDLTVHYSTDTVLSPVVCDIYHSPAGNTYSSSGTYFEVIQNANNCDSNIQIDLTVNYSTSNQIQALACDTFIAPSGAVYTQSGQYTDVIPNSKGCDSTIFIDLTVNYSTQSFIQPTACDTFISPAGNVYTQSGTYHETILNSQGCDSNITIDLDMKYSTTSTISPVACDQYTSPAQNIYSSSGTYYETILNSQGCDSNITINLTVNYSTDETIAPVVCDTFYSPAGNIYTQSGSYFETIQNSQGCDSNITIDLTVNYSTQSFIQPTACDTFISPAGNVYTQSGTYHETILNSQGCDSNITIDLDMKYSTTSTISPVACDQYTSPAQNIYSSSGTYYETILNSQGCDSNITINLTVNYSTQDFVQATVCDSFLSPAGNVYTQSGSFSETITNSQGCDSNIYIDLTVNYSSQNFIQATACDTFISPAGNVYTQSGTYHETILNSQGCDSNITIDLDMRYSTSGTISPVACDSYFYPPTETTYTTSGTYYETILNSQGCDSNITINLTVNYSTDETITPVVCDTFYSPAGNIYTQSGSYFETIQNSQGCDSNITIDLTVNYSTQSFIQATACDTFISPAGNVYTQSGTYHETILNGQGCDSNITIDLDVRYSTSATISPVACDQYTSPAQNIYSSSGTYYETILNSQGCDSNITINLTVNYSSAETINPVVCDTFYSPAGNVYTQSGSYFETIQNSQGCDSNITIDLTVNYSTQSFIQATACDTFISPAGNVYTQSGTYHETILNSQGCDSNITLDLDVRYTTSAIISPVSCDLYISPAQNIYSSSGTYFETILNSQGCDSNITINLVMNYSTAETINPVVCDTFISPAGNIYTQSGSYFETIQNSQGCDSNITIDLTVNYTSSETIQVDVCDSYLSPLGNTYTQTGVYNETLVNTFNCDSLLTIDLIIRNATAETISPVVCDVYNSPAGNVYTQSGIYNETILNAAGCDSNITIDLTVLYSTSSVLSPVVCDQYLSPAGNIYTTTGVYNETIPNAAGCDSNITINLTVNYSTDETINPVACDSYTSPAGATYTQSGTYFETIPNAIGCDSNITINLTVNYTTYGAITTTVCDLFTAPSGQLLTTSGIYSDTITNQNNCDSVITIDLTVKYSTFAAFTIYECESYTLPSGQEVTVSGTYIDTIPNAVNCDSVMTFYLNINPAPIVQLAVTTPMEFCSNGSLELLNNYVNVGGGTFDILLADTTLSDEFTPEELPVGSYDFTYSIDTGCYLPVTGTMVIFAPPTISTINKINNNSCSGTVGYLEMGITPGDDQNITYLWSTGNTSSLSIADLSNGVYTLEAIDGNGCEAKHFDQITTTGVTFNSTVEDVSCFGGSDGKVTMNSVQGMNGQLFYLWSNGQSGPIATNLAAGSHFVMVKDASNCEMIHLVQVGQPNKMNFNASIVQPDCGSQNGSVSLSVTGGTPGYSYQWSNQSSGSSISNLGYGVYNVMVTDNNGCIRSKDYAVNELNSPNLGAIVSKTGCNIQSGSIDLIVYPNGGPGTFNYTWNDQVTTEDRAGLDAGNYAVEVFDVNGCIAVGSYDIVVRPPLKNEICIVTVDSATTSNLVVWEKAELVGIDYYNIYRESGVAGEFSLIDSVDFDDVSVFNDVVASPASTSWKYRLSAVNDCGVEGPLSNVHKTIHINKTDLATNVVRLDWNYYLGTSYTHFIVSRYTDVDGYRILDTIPASLRTFTDFPPSNAGLDYFVGFELLDPCTATGKAEDYNYVRSNRSAGIFTPGYGTGNSSNGLTEEMLDDTKVHLYPNPVTDNFNVYLDGQSELTYTITDGAGRIIDRGILYEGTNALSSNEWAKGVYYLNLYNMKDSKTVKFVK